MAIEYLGEILLVTVFVGLTFTGILTILIGKKNSANKASYLRFFVQAVSEIAIFIVISYSLWLGIVVAVLFLLTFFIGRFFCGWICPFGFYMDIVTMVRKALNKRYVNLPEKVNLTLHRLRYAIFLVLLILPLFLVSLEDTQRWLLALYLLGPFNSPRILLGPMVPAFTPWKALFNLNLNFPYVDQIIYYSTPSSVVFNVLVFVVLTITCSFVVRRFWCRFCPTGFSFGVVNRIKTLRCIPLLHLTKEESKCTKCGICKRVCPLQVTEVYELKGGRVQTSMCMLCLRCVEMCPSEDALKLKISSKTVYRSRNWLNPSNNE